MLSFNSTPSLDHTDLPGDILECILDNFVNDRRTLASCTLVCRSLLHPSRSRLFRSVFRKSRGGENAGTILFELQVHPFPELVRTLELSAFGQHLCTRHVLPAILMHLPNLDELKLWGLETRCSCDGASREPEQLPRGLFQLRKLELHHLAHRTPDAFLDFLGLFSEIDTLSINCDAILIHLPIRGAAGVQDPSVFTDGTGLDQLCIRSANIRGSTAATTSCLLFHILLVTPSAQSLRTLHATFDCAADLLACTALLPHCPNLRHVDFGQWLTFDQKDYHLWDRLSLRECGSLEECTVATTLCAFSILFTEAIESKLQQNMAIINVLSRLPPSVRHVTIIFNETDPDMGTLRDCYDWKQLCDMLEPLCSQLRTLTLKISDIYDSESRFAQLKEFVEGKTASLRGKACVRIMEQAERQWWYAM
ncbi:hypothetical protein EIP91_010152 [Steccherinum ochraceum]|uniref:F-box domain-containing protein n=1 Tax=Steccherinum ochraceum TaxID=92696 RepID=A0A4R0RTZ8_9APHY|nr:hypothetical protein EIP91_010152 [Steccherinum ochraceum]